MTLSDIPDILQKILTAKRDELEERRRVEPLSALQERAAERRGAMRRLFPALVRGPGENVRVIAEIKMASPSAGRLMDAARRPGLARLYASNGAAAISVLTEQPHFQGDLAHLQEARREIDGLSPTQRPPLLRKDFLFDPYHLWEAVAYGADAALLIVAALSNERLREMLTLAETLGLDCLVETHDEAELERAIEAGARIIGINNRDLRTFKVDLATTEQLTPLIQSDRVVVSESGIRSRDDVDRLGQAGVDAVLVGETLVRSDDPAAKLRELAL